MLICFVALVVEDRIHNELHVRRTTENILPILRILLRLLSLSLMHARAPEFPAGMKALTQEW